MPCVKWCGFLSQRLESETASETPILHPNGIGVPADAFSEYDRHLKRASIFLVSLVLAALLSACGRDLSKESDAELGLSAQQSNGRRIFQLYCASCHNAYSSSGLNGPAMKGVFKNKYLPSGLPANDRFVKQAIVNGRGMMPAFGEALSPQQIDDLIAYLHSL